MQIPQFIGESLSKDLLQHSQAQEILAAVPKATRREMCNSDRTQGTAKKGTGYLGPGVLPSSLHYYTLHCHLLPASHDGLKPRKLYKKSAYLLGNSLLSCAGLNRASRCPSTQKDHMKSVYLQEIYVYFKVIFKASIMTVLKCNREKGGLYMRVFILCRYSQFSAVKKQ